MFIQNSLNVIIFKFQMILLNIEGIVGITHLAIGKDTQLTHHVVAIRKVTE